MAFCLLIRMRFAATMSQRSSCPPLQLQLHFTGAFNLGNLDIIHSPRLSGFLISSNRFQTGSGMDTDLVTATLPVPVPFGLPGLRFSVIFKPVRSVVFRSSIIIYFTQLFCAAVVPMGLQLSAPGAIHEWMEHFILTHFVARGLESGQLGL